MKSKISWMDIIHKESFVNRPKNLLRNVPVEKVKEFETAFLTTLKKKHKTTLAELKTGKLSDNALDTLNAVAQENSKAFE